MRQRHEISAVRSVVLYPRDGQPARDAAATATQWLLEHGARVGVPEEIGSAAPSGCEVVSPDAIAEFDLVVALGGDGTLLRAARCVGETDVPVMGVNLGALGFLSAYGASQVTEALQAAVAGELVWEARLQMRVDVGDETQVAFNDIYVKHGEIPRMLVLTTKVGGDEMARYRADGLIVSTPMGSTAYNLAAGGPIVDAGADTFTITPICPHSLKHRPVVTASDSEIAISFDGPDDAGPATLSVDGQWATPLQVGDEISISKAQRFLRLVPPHASVFEVLRHKLGWSG